MNCNSRSGTVSLVTVNQVKQFNRLNCCIPHSCGSSIHIVWNQLHIILAQNEIHRIHELSEQPYWNSQSR